MKILVNQMPSKPKECLFCCKILVLEHDGDKKKAVENDQGCRLTNKVCKLANGGRCNKLMCYAGIGWWYDV